MADGARFPQDVADAQVRMFAMFVGPGLWCPRTALAAASGIPESTLKSYADGAAMPVHALLALARVLPPEAINMLTETGGFHLIPTNAAITNWDALGAAAAGFVSDLCAARQDGQIDHRERGALKNRLRKLIPQAQAMVEDGEALP